MLHGNPTIMLAVADPATQAFLGDQLTYDGAQILTADSERLALERLRGRLVDVLVVDLPGGNLESLIRHGQARVKVALTGTPPATRELVVTRLFDLGADDVLTKPFSYPELRARIGRHLTRVTMPQGPILEVGDLRMDLRARIATLGRFEVDLTGKEWSLLRTLASEPHRVFTKQELLRSIWGQQAGGTRTLDAHASRLRRKLAQLDGGHWVRNVWGVGYRLLDPITVEVA